LKRVLYLPMFNNQNNYKMENKTLNTTLLGDIYYYEIVLNTKYNHYRVNEYKNGEFFTDYGQYKTKKLATNRLSKFTNK